MKRLKKLLRLCAAVTVAISMAGTADAGLKDVGLEKVHGFPAWYRDNSVLPGYPNGIPLELCLTPGPCVLPAAGEEPGFVPGQPLVISSAVAEENPVGIFTGNFPSESFYFLVEAGGAIGGGDLIYTAAIEAAFGGDGNPGAGLQFPFVRVRIDLKDVPNGTYRIQHPYGTQTLVVTGGDARYVSDIPLKFAPPLDDTASTMTTFLLPSATPGGEPLGPYAVGSETFIADPNRSGPVTNGPFRNSIIVSGGADLTIENFTLTGKVTVFPAVASITPPGITDFGMVGVANPPVRSAPLSFTVANTAELPGAPVTVNSVLFSDPQFQVDPAASASSCPPAPFNVAAGTSCTIDVVFTPTVPNAASTTVTISTSAAAEPAVFTLTGTGVIDPPTVALTAPPASGIIGSPVTFSAIGGGPAGSYDYRYLLSADNGATWSTMQDGASGSWTWNTATAALGAYQVRVEIRPQGQAAVLAAAQATAQFSLLPPQVALLASKASETIGLPVVFTVTGGGAAGIFDYRFLVSSDGGATWSTMQDSLSSTWTWDTDTATTGNHLVRAELRLAGQTGVVAAAQSTVPVTLTPPVVTLAGSKTSEILGLPVAFTAAGGGLGIFDYRFLVSSNGGSTWSVMQDSGAAAWTWNTVAAQAGSHQVKVELRLTGQPDTLPLAEATASLQLVQFTFSVSANPPGPTNSGLPVLFTAAAPGLPNLQYQFKLFINNGWQVVKPFSAANTWTWATGGIPAGLYPIQVEISGAPTPVAPVNLEYRIAGRIPPPNSVRLIASSTRPVPGSVILLTASATGAGNYEYEYQVRVGRTWETVQAFSTQSTWNWTAPAARGTHRVRVVARALNDVGGITRQQELLFRIR